MNLNRICSNLLPSPSLHHQQKKKATQKITKVERKKIRMGGYFQGEFFPGRYFPDTILTIPIAISKVK